MAVLFDLARKATSSFKNRNARDTSNSVPRDKIPPNTLPEIMGLPPEYGVSFGNANAPNMNDVIKDSFPVIEFIPCEPTLKKGLEMFTLESKMDEYNKELNNFYGYKLAGEGKHLYFAVQGNSFPIMESFSNEVGESVFQLGSDMASSVLRDFTFMAGTKNASHGIDQITGLMENLAGGSNNMQAFDDKIGRVLGKTLGGAQSIANSQGMLGQAGNIIAETLAGRAIDFPMVWRSSSWSPSYNVNIRLYNPYPGDERSTKEFIIGPLATLLMFVVPRSSNGYNFGWPWLCKYKIPGLYDIQAGFIKDVTVIKGGDDNHFALNGIPGLVDVRITLGTLYSTMLGGNPAKMKERGNPKLHQWLDQMTSNPNSKDDPPTKPGPKNWSNNSPGFSIESDSSTPAGAVQGPDWKTTGYSSGRLDAETILSQAAAIASIAPGVTQQTSEILNNRDQVPNRISAYSQNQYSALKSMGG